MSEGNARNDGEVEEEKEGRCEEATGQPYSELSLPARCAPRE